MVRGAINLASKFLQNKKYKSQSKLGSCSGNNGVGVLRVSVFEIVDGEVILRSREGFGMITGS